MTDSQQPRPDEERTRDVPSADASETHESAPSHETPAPANETPAPEVSQTVGTGTGIALGCVAGTIVLVLIGILFLGIVLILG